MTPVSASELRQVHASSFGDRLHALRLQRGWNMDRVAAAAGISRTTLFHLERDVIQRPRASTLHKLARVFDVPVESLRSGETAFGVIENGEAAPRAAETISSHFRMPNTDYRNDADTCRRAFDRATNPVVAQVATEEPQLFFGWSPDDWDELYSQFATGGALREEGVRVTAARINHDRETLYRLRVILQTHLADVASGMVDTLYRLVSVEPASEAQSETEPDHSQLTARE